MAGKVIRAAGLVVYRLIESKPQYLLLQHAPSKYGPGLHWTPPKGHVDPGEDELRTAYRETEEEAGINQSQLELIEGFKETLQYDVTRGPKTVVYWLARVKDPNVPVKLSNEHQASGWFDIDAAVSKSEYEIMIALLRKADDFIKGLSKI